MKLYFLFFILLGLSIADELPEWIISNPGFRNPLEINSINTGNGTIMMNGKKDVGWRIHISDKLGFGVEVDLNNISLVPETQSYIAVLGWPLSQNNFKEIKIFTGNLRKKERVRIPATKSILILYCASGDSRLPIMEISYRRYGVSYEKSPPTTESPIKKETLYEIQLKGKAPEEYFEGDFVAKLKTAFVSMAKTFCLHNNIPFNHTADPLDMVFFGRISFCPFEWPDRQLCTSIQHSIFVSGTKGSSGIIMNYELTADHLRDMWLTIPTDELQKLGLSIFKLPETSDTVLWWCLVAGFVTAVSLLAILLFLAVEKCSYNLRLRAVSTTSEPVVRRKKIRATTAPHQKIPPFMYGDDSMETKKFHDVIVSDSPSTNTIKSYFGSFLFNNKGFEDEEETVTQFTKK